MSGTPIVSGSSLQFETTDLHYPCPNKFRSTESQLPALKITPDPHRITAECGIHCGTDPRGKGGIRSEAEPSAARVGESVTVAASAQPANSSSELR
jgi:hypothetical protein